MQCSTVQCSAVKWCALQYNDIDTTLSDLLTNYWTLGENMVSEVLSTTICTSTEAQIQPFKSQFPSCAGGGGAGLYFPMTHLRHTFMPVHRALGLKLTLMKNSKWERQHKILVPEMLHFPTVTNCLLMTISVCHRLGGGGACGVLGWTLNIKGGTERNLMLPWSEVLWSFWELKVFPRCGRHLAVFSINSKFF